MLPEELQSLLDKYLDNVISEEEFRRLWKTLPSNKYNDNWYAAIEKAITTRKRTGFSDAETAKLALENIKAAIAAAGQHPRPSVSITGSVWFKAAAAVILVAGAAFFLLTGKPEGQPLATMPSAAPAQQDIPPAGNTTLLTLADGSTINLEDAGNGKIAQQGNVQVIKLSNGEVAYRVLGNQGSAALNVTNTMSTQRGGQYNLILPDGSRVWLNAESSITYPVIFAGHERKVTITGEAYFEVAKDKSKPFLVDAGDVHIEVLGTHFNVNAYRDNGMIKTTLLEGSVKINNSVMKPGDAYIDGKIIPTDVEQDVAWKNGVFNFNDQNLSQIMRQLARWYDVEVEFPAGVPDKQYGGEIGRDLTLLQVLKGLENSGIHFELQGRRLIVRP